MGLRNTTTEWGSLAKPLHWLIAIGLFALIYLGLEQAGHEFWGEFHEVAWIPVAVLIVVHILGSRYNHFGLKNDVLRRVTHGVK